MTIRKQEKEAHEEPPMYVPVGLTDRYLSGCRCVSAGRFSKDIEVYLDM